MACLIPNMTSVFENDVLSMDLLCIGISYLHSARQCRYGFFLISPRIVMEVRISRAAMVAMGIKIFTIFVLGKVLRLILGGSIIRQGKWNFVVNDKFKKCQKD